MECHDERAWKGDLQAMRKCDPIDLLHCVVAVIAGDAAEMLGFPGEQCRSMGFWHEGEDEEEDEAGSEESDPLGPTPGVEVGRLSYPGAHDGTQGWAAEAEEGEEGEDVCPFDGSVHVRDTPASADERCRAGEAS